MRSCGVRWSRRWGPRHGCEESGQDPERSRACTIMDRGVVRCWESCADMAISRGHLEFSHQLFRVTQQNEKGKKIVVQPSNMGFRGTTRLKGAVLTLLSVLAVGQVVALERRTPRLDALDPRVTVGHDVSELVVRDSDGAMIELGAPYETLLLVFDPDCPYSARVAETWASWLAKQDSGRPRTYAVSSGPLPAAVRYAREMQWNVRVGSVDGSGGDHPLTDETDTLGLCRRCGRTCVGRRSWCPAR